MGRRGRVLVEAKAHENEPSISGNKPSSVANDGSLKDAIAEASNHLNAITPGWRLRSSSHYQLANRSHGPGSWRLSAYP